MGIGLGIGMGIAFAKQQQQIVDSKRQDEEKARIQELQQAVETRKNRHAEIRHQSLASIQTFLAKKP
jgi:hypothetical protein